MRSQMRRRLRGAGEGRRARRESSFGDSGLGLIEVVVSVVLLIVVSLPTSIAIINAQRSTGFDTESSQAYDLASQYVEQQVEAADGDAFHSEQLIQTSKYAQTTWIRDYEYTLSANISIQTGSASPCESPEGSGESQELYVLSVNVSWQGPGVSTGNGGPISLTAELSPVAASTSTTAGEIAVPIETLNTTPDDTDLVYMSVAGAWTESGTAPAVPSGEFTSETEADPGTGSEVANGCVVFPNLDPAAGWSYTVSVVYCGVNGNVSNCTSATPEIVQDNEDGALSASDDAAAPAIPSESNLDVVAAGITIANPFYLAEAATVPISFATYEYPSGGGAPTAYPSAWEPTDVLVGVQNEHLSCNSVGSSCELGNGLPEVSVATPPDLYLYPYTDGYSSVYAGDETESNPLAESAGTTPTSYYFTGTYTQPTATTPALPVQTASVADTTEPALKIPLYYAPLSVKCSLTAGQSFTGLVFTEVDGAGSSYEDQPATTPTCTSTTAAAFNVGLPLGEYAVSPVGNGSPTINSSGAGYIWVTPFGVCSAPNTTDLSNTVAPVTACSGTGLTWSTTSTSIQVS